MATELLLPLLLMGQVVVVEVRYATGSREPVPNAEVIMWRNGQPEDRPRSTNRRGQVRYSPLVCSDDDEIVFQARLRSGSNPQSARTYCRHPTTPVKIRD